MIVAPVRAGRELASVAPARLGRSDFADVYRANIDTVYRYLLVAVGDRSDAEDLCAQTFLAAYEGIDQYRSQGTVRAWLLAIARHKLIDARRRSHAKRLSPEMDIPAEDADARPAEVAIMRAQLVEVRSAVEALPADQAEAVRLRFFGGLSSAEIARAMRRSEGAVRVLVHRGVRSIREALGG